MGINMTAEQFYEEVQNIRGVQEPCKECSGFGTKVYGSTATWRGGVGGQALTTAVCDRCWGSGDSNRPWPSHRRLLESTNPTDATSDPLRHLIAFWRREYGSFGYLSGESLAQMDRAVASIKRPTGDGISKG